MLKSLSAAALALALAGSADATTQLPTIEPFQVNTKNIGLCEIYDPKDPYANGHSLSPISAIYAYVESYQTAYLKIKPTDYSVKYLELPQHGNIKSISGEDGLHEVYVPNFGYAGNDRYIAEVTVKGVKFKVIGFIRPSSDVMSGYDDICRRLGLPSAAWKIEKRKRKGKGVRLDFRIDSGWSPTNFT